MSYVDADGNILAMEDTEVPPPWVVLESSKFKGRFYFFNNETKKHAWSLDPSIVNGTAGKSPGKTSGVEREGSSRPRPSDLPRIEEKVSNSGAVRNPTRNSVFLSPISSLPSVGLQGPRENGARRSILVEESRPKFNSFEDARAVLPDPSVDLPLLVLNGLGQGGYGVVMKVENEVTKQILAMKVVGKHKLRRRRDRERLALELKIMDCMGHSPFCQQFYQAFETKTSVFIVMDLQGGGDLFFHLMERIGTKGTAFSEKEVCVLVAELTLALEHVHREGFIHRDLKGENVMLDSSGHVKLIDFGLAVELINDVQPLSPTGSLIYMAPEMVVEHTGGRHTDWWALGVLAYEMLTGSSPWSVIDDRQILKKHIRSQKVSTPPGISTSTGRFIDHLLKKDFRYRLGSRSDSDVKDAPFFDSIDWALTAESKSAPAFVPPKSSVGAEEMENAEELYMSLSEADRLAAPGDSALCTMGLRVADRFPAPRGR